MQLTSVLRPANLADGQAELELALDMIDAPVLFVSHDAWQVVGGNRAAQPVIETAGRLGEDWSLSDLFVDPQPLREALDTLHQGEQEFATRELRWSKRIDASQRSVTVKLSCLGDRLVIVATPPEIGPAFNAQEVDALTELPTRRVMDNRLAQLIERRAANWGLLFLDLNNYKTVNDQLGHVIGDLVLAAFARELELHARPSDLIVRYGGDEFVVLVDEVTSQSDLDRMSARIASEVLVHVNEAVPPLTVSASVGAVLAWPELRNPKQIIDAADKAMYASKRACA